MAENNECSLKPLAFDQVNMTGDIRHRQSLATQYMISLKNENLLQNYYWEAGIVHRPILRETDKNSDDRGDDLHWGWESPMCQLRGHFLGHWLSAAYRMSLINDEAQLKAKADWIVKELARCQKRNGGQWCGSIPEKYLDWTAKGQPTWAPQYVLHKTIMGLIDAYRFGQNEQALDIVVRQADWFLDWTSQFSQDQLDDLFDIETGGLLEAWADLYAITGQQKHLDLMLRYERRRLFDRLLSDSDALTNRHANTTIPEVHGAARAYEVTGDQRWLLIAEAYWKYAVTERGYFCTGGQTSGEIWTAPFSQAARLSTKNQEHCSVYNMIRLADYLYRSSGDINYLDYIERNMFNGLMAQQHPETGMVAYFLPLQAGSKKIWGTPTYDFWCCHGSVIQAQSVYNQMTYYKDHSGYVVAQYLPSEFSDSYDGARVQIKQRLLDTDNSIVYVHTPDTPEHRPSDWKIEIFIQLNEPKEFSLKLRVPWWLAGKAQIFINDQFQTEIDKPSSYVELKRAWKNDTIRLILPKKLDTFALPDEPETVAFMDGPVVLAGLCDQQRTLYGDTQRPETILKPNDERQWREWLPGWRTVKQPVNMKFMPLKDITDQTYTTYFPICQDDNKPEAKIDG